MLAKSRFSPSPAANAASSIAATMGEWSAIGLWLPYDPVVSGIVTEDPVTIRPCHHVEIIAVISMRGANRMIASGDHDDVTVLDGDGLVDRSIVGIDPLDRKALRRIEAVIIGFLQSGLFALGRRVVLVRRIAGPMAAGCDDFNDEQAFGRFRFGKDVPDEALVGALAPDLPAHPIGVD